MAELNDFSFLESQYRYTDPIRYFTSTDPYYWEIDNIPLKQLQENDQWLKDQIEFGFKNFRVSFERQDFLELKPFTDSTDNIVKVKPGRFTARINDATSDNRLQIVTRLAGEVFNDVNKWRFATYSNEQLAQNLDKIVSEVGDDALFMNGLMERVFTWQTRTPYEVFSGIDSVAGIADALYGPVGKLYGWPGDQYTAVEKVNDESSDRPDRGLRFSATIESILTKFWRGVFRLSVVDVPDELQIEVPAFNARDYDYFDEDENLIQNNNVDVRIDLLFVYAKPIDASAIKVRGSNLGSYRVLNNPTLGLVRGAGVILRPNPPGNSGIPGAGTNGSSSTTFDENGNLKILASPADTESTRGGFKGLDIKGSFPSPDDLLNVAPLIVEDLETNDPRLVGQSVLPLAYIVVKKDATVNSNFVNVITTEDIVDIRPFLRTAELTYSERAGIAASVPQLSIANPVVTDIKLKNVVVDVVKDYDTKLAALERDLRNINGVTGARVVGGGYIYGGLAFGPEGAIMSKYHSENNSASYSDNLTRLTSTYSLPENRPIPYVPDWDHNNWAPVTGRKQYPNDCVYVNRRYSKKYKVVYGNGRLDAHDVEHPPVFSRFMPNGRAEFTGKSSRRYVPVASRQDQAALESTYALDDLATNTNLIYYCKKTISLDKTAVAGWMGDYVVHASLVNCVPLSHTRPNIMGGLPMGGSSHIWVDYKKNEFTIHVAWVGLQELPMYTDGQRRKLTDRAVNTPYFNGGHDTDFQQLEVVGMSFYRNESALTAGFTVINNEMSEKLDSNTDYLSAGGCIYPTVKFSIVGFPSGSLGSLADENPEIILNG